MNLLASREWMRRKIKEDRDLPCEAGHPVIIGIDWAKPDSEYGFVNGKQVFPKPSNPSTKER